MPDTKFKADCGSCSGLCCVAPAFDADQGFGYDKAAHIPCTNLLDNFRCSVHQDLARCGFVGCTVYDCHGAGQWVTQVLFKGASWRDSPQTAQAMFAAFSRQTVLHELMLLLTTAMQYSDDSEQQMQLGEKLREIENISLVKPDGADDSAVDKIKQSTMLLLKSLRQSHNFTELKARHPA
ncbi:MAG: hypothetical protein V4628_03215 [Pseudomonadota bacterium]